MPDLIHEPKSESLVSDRSGFYTFRDRLRNVRPATRFIDVVGGGFALAGAWVVLEQGEYGVALALTTLYVVLALLSVFGWELLPRQPNLSRIAKFAVMGGIATIGLYTALLIIQKKGDKGWTTLTLWQEPTRAPSPAPVVMATPQRQVELPTPMGVASPTPYFTHFIYDYKTLHKGYNVYRVLSMADSTPCEYFARFGLLTSEEVRLLIYVVKPYAAREAVASVVTNYNQIVQDLKLRMRQEGTEIIDLKVSRTVVVYLDIEHGPQIPIPEDPEKKGLRFEFERRIAGF